MKKFSDEEFSLIEDLINKIAKEDKDTKKQLNFSNEERSGSREVNYITETINWDISFKGEEFNFNFNKHFIDMNPEEKYEKSFGILQLLLEQDATNSYANLYTAYNLVELGRRQSSSVSK